MMDLIRRSWASAGCLRVFDLAVLLVLSGASLAPAPVTAAISEPDHLFYGVVVENGSALFGANVELRLGDETGEVLASDYTGASTSSPDLYLLTVRVESPTTPGEARSAGIARIGDLATLVVSGNPMAQLSIGGRGLFVQIDVDLGSGGGPGPNDPTGDVDTDGTPNYLDNCSLPNADQLDTDGDGVGDVCDGVTNAAGTMLDIDASGLGNGADPTTGFGSVNYAYQVADTEVTNAQYRQMLVAVGGVSDPQGLFNGLMASDPRGGILRNGTAGAWSYALKPNMANKPVNFVSWLDAARYTNWLFNGSPRGLAGAGTTESGAFDLQVVDPSLNAVAGMQVGWSLPTEHEWYKAAYFDPTLDAYWIYPTQSDSEPLLAAASGAGDVSNPGPDRVNYASSADWNGLDGHVTSVGSAGATSAYGGYDMAGNVWEWTAADSEAGLRVVRGGSYRDDRFSIEAEADGDRNLLLRTPGYEAADVGMRVASILQVPEPSFGLALVMGSAGLLGLRRRGPLVPIG